MPKVKSQLEAADHLIVALDVPSVFEARQIVSDLNGLVSFFKIGPHIQWDKELYHFIEELLDQKYRLFFDFKYSDIGNTMQGGVAGAARIGATFLTLQGSGEAIQSGMDAAVKGRGKNKYPKLLLVTVLTSVNDADIRVSGRYQNVSELVLARAEMALNAGLDGIITSGHEASTIRALVPDDFLIVTPGIRPILAGQNDQKRIMTPKLAIASGANYLVVGRPIVNHINRRLAAESVVNEMFDAFATFS